MTRRYPALIEDTSFYNVRDLHGDGRGLASACACKDQVGGWVCLIEESWRSFRHGGKEDKQYTAVLFSVNELEFSLD